VSNLNLKMRTASMVFQAGASIINNQVLIEDGGWRQLTDIEETVVLKALINTQKEDAKKSILQLYEKIRANISGYADQYKVAGWNDKYQRAERVIANLSHDVDTSILQAECDKRGRNETPEELANKQINKAKKLAMAVAIIDGMEAAALEAIDSKRNENTLAELLKDLKAQANIQLTELLEAGND